MLSVSTTSVDNELEEMSPLAQKKLDNLLLSREGAIAPPKDRNMRKRQ